MQVEHSIRPRNWQIPVVCAAALLAQACSEPPSPPETVIRPVRYVSVVPTAEQRIRTFSGVARAASESSLSFRVPGAIASLAVEVGDRVEPGHSIAYLDPVDYELQVREVAASLRQAEARMENARAELRRVRRLYENDNAARTDLDAATAAAESSAATVDAVAKRLDLARRQVEHTRLVAPTGGAIARVLAEENENVAAGQAIVVLASGAVPEVGLAVPEALIREIRKGTAATVTFDAIPNRQYLGTVTEVGVTAGATGTTFPVSVRLGPAASEIRAGMAASVEMAFGAGSEPGRFILPTHAVGEDRAGRFVYVADPNRAGIAVVRRCAVKVGQLLPGGIEVTEGVAEGDRVIVAGVSRLQHGDEVRLGTASSL